MILTVTMGASMTQPFDIVGHDDASTERAQRAIVAVAKDFRSVYLSDGSTMAVDWMDEEGDEVDELDEACYLIGGDIGFGYFSIAVAPLLTIVEH